MEGDDREDRKRPHSQPRDHHRHKASRSDREEGWREDPDRDRSRDRGERASRHSDFQAESRRQDNGSRDGYRSHGRGGLSGQVVRIARSRDGVGSPGDRPRRPADEYASPEGRRDYSRERSGRPGDERSRSESHGGREGSSRLGDGSEVRRERTNSTGSSGSQGAAVFRLPPSPNGSTDSRGGSQFREPPSPNGSLASRGRSHFQEPTSPVVPSGSRGRGFSREPPRSPDEAPYYRGQERIMSAAGPSRLDGWPENQGGEFSGSRRASSGSSNGDRLSTHNGSSRSRDGSSSRPSPVEPSGNLEDSAQAQTSPTGSTGSRGGGSSRPAPEQSSAVRGGGFSRNGTRGQRSDGPGLQARLQNFAAPTNSTVNVNDPTQDKIGGRRGARPPRPSDAVLADFVRTRPKDKDKRVQSAQLEKVTLMTNYYKLNARHSWALYHYHVDFEPEVERTFAKRALFRPHANKLGGWHIFDGSALYSANRVPPEHLNLYSCQEGSEEKILIKISPEPKIVDEFDPVRIQVNNIIIRSCMRELSLQEIGRNYYDPGCKIPFNHHRLQIWPGYKTSIRQHEYDLLLCVEMTNKVFRDETALDVIRGHRGDRESAKNELLGAIVMTPYNKRTYRIDDVNWDESPLTTFKMKDGEISFIDYYRDKYNVPIRDRSQPILYSKAKRKDVRKGMCRNIAIIPELCMMTGLKDDHRKDFALMKELNVHLQMNPQARVDQIRKFSRLLQAKGVSEKVLKPAGLQLGTDLVKLTGHVLKPEAIYLGNGRTCNPRREMYDWSKDVVSNPMMSTVTLANWAVIDIQQGANTDTFIRLIKQTAQTMGFRIDENYGRYMASRHARSYVEQIENIMHAEKDKIQMIMCILPTQDENLYGEIKRKCYLDFGVPSQCVLSRNVAGRNPHKTRGVAAKLAIQMNTKLGGVPWQVNFPFSKSSCMVVGFNISAMGRQRGSNTRRSVGALVATLNKEQTKYFSCIVDQDQGQSLSTLLGAKLVQALHAFTSANDGNLPDRIIFYRDGMGDGQLQSVVDTEVQEVKSAYTALYQSRVPAVTLPGFAFIVVNKRLSTKFFLPDNNRRMHVNPLPGTCVDDVVTLPERYDFYLIATKGTGQGTLSPTGYNVIHDESNYSPAILQQLTYKMCHMYFNWSSTVSVPAPCQYAHKLAFLQNLMNKTGRRENGSSEPKPQLCNTLFYL